jgi:hypothetical protein
MFMQSGKPLVWLHGEVKTPPLSTEARIEFGVLLRRLQNGERLSLPESAADVVDRYALSRATRRRREEQA